MSVPWANAPVAFRPFALHDRSRKLDTEVQNVICGWLLGQVLQVNGHRLAAHARAGNERGRSPHPFARPPDDETGARLPGPVTQQGRCRL